MPTVPHVRTRVLALNVKSDMTSIVQATFVISVQILMLSAYNALMRLLARNVRIIMHC